MTAKKIILIGLSGAGKTTIAKQLSSLLSWKHIDTDQLIEEQFGKSPAVMIEEDGESKFREAEEQCIKNITDSNVVVSIGGGAFQSQKNRKNLFTDGLVVFLDAPIQTLVDRIKNSKSEQKRPLLGSSLQTQENLINMDQQRRDNFLRADLHLFTYNQAPENIAKTIIKFWIDFNLDDKNLLRYDAAEIIQLPVTRIAINNHQFPIFAGVNQLNELPQLIARISTSQKVYIITDENVHNIYGSKIAAMLDDQKITHLSYILTPGENQKNSANVDLIYKWLFENKIERQDLIIALGGGVVCDLVGYVAATVLRGVKLLSMPTSLLAMTDAAIGGKTAVNLNVGKNLIGVIKQPDAILIDVNFLETLPEREITEGMAEVIKHAIILDKTLFQIFDEHKGNTSALIQDKKLLLDIIVKSVRIKSMIVSIDPNEKNIRKILNFGHTIGHALEVASEYKSLLHGEAVAIGMVGATQISHKLGYISAEDVDNIVSIIKSYNLPVSFQGMSIDSIMEYITFDKKVVNKQVQFILINDIGVPAITTLPDNQLILETLKGLQHD